MTDFITLIANVSLALSFVIALVFGIAQVRTANRDRRERLTMEALRVFQTRDFAELIYFTLTVPAPKDQAEFNKWPGEDQIRMIEFGQLMENLGLLVAERYINIDLVDKTLGSFVVTSWRKYHHVYEDMRINNNDPFLCEYFQWLAEYIDKRMKDYPRQPFQLQNTWRE